MTEAINGALKGRSNEFFVQKNGREHRINVNGIESEGQIFGVVLLIFDVTEQAMFRRNRQEFTANVSHELKTPLQSIIGSAELLENNLVKPEDVSRFVGHIKREAKRMVDLVNDTIKLSHLDEMTEISKEEFVLLELASEVVDALEGLATQKNVRLYLAGEEFYVSTVKKYMYDILFNLCENAIRYNVENGEVKILIERGKIVVMDTGIGIPKEHQERVFERFYRVDKSHSRETGGTGLGLAIVKNAVQYFGGQINISSVINQGTSVEITFEI
jgi:two-component system phosphate regulon sensor histidine kinase PhoR